MRYLFLIQAERKMRRIIIEKLYMSFDSIFDCRLFRSSRYETIQHSNSEIHHLIISFWNTHSFNIELQDNTIQNTSNWRIRHIASHNQFSLYSRIIMNSEPWIFEFLLNLFVEWEIIVKTSWTSFDLWFLRNIFSFIQYQI